MDAAAGDKEARDGSPVIVCIAEAVGQAPMEIAASPISDEDEQEVIEEAEIPVWDGDDDRVVDLKTKAELQELHIAYVKSFTELDPRKNLWVHTRFLSKLSNLPSKVELVLAPVESPVAASLEVNVSKGAAPFSGKTCAGTSSWGARLGRFLGVGAKKSSRGACWGRGWSCSQMILYDSRDTKCRSSIVLTHNLIAVPDPDDEEDEIGVYVRFLDDDEDAGTVVNLAYPAEEQVCGHGAWEMQVKVSWTAILCKPMAKHVLTRGASIPRAYTCPKYEPLF
ncbi:hypothetical protein VPH35_134012 [Triticum aestivum]